MKLFFYLVPEFISSAGEIFVDGMVMPDATSMGMKYQFVLSGGEEGVTLCTVEHNLTVFCSSM